MIRSLMISSALTVLASASIAHADVPIVGLANTGTPAGPAAGDQPGDEAKDANWTLNTETRPYVGTPINPAWLANTATSSWVTPLRDGNASLDPSVAGSYVYGLTFDLTGFRPSTGQFTGRFAVDNIVESILLNGVAITGSGGSFDRWTAFAATSGFVAGVNTLQFNVRNTAQATGNPTGLRVEFLSSSIGAVPEPATWAMMILGFGVIGGAMRRRRATSHTGIVRTQVAYA